MGYHVTTPYIYKPKPPNGHSQTDGHGQSKPTIRHQAPVDPPMPFPTLQQPVEALSITERQLPGESHRTETVNGLKLLYLSNSLNYVCECTDIVFCLFYLPHAGHYKHVLRKPARFWFGMQSLFTWWSAGMHFIKERHTHNNYTSKNSFTLFPVILSFSFKCHHMHAWHQAMEWDLAPVWRRLRSKM